MLEARTEVTMQDLLRATLRMRPDRIVVGDLRGPEALDLVQAMTSGYAGCLAALQATHLRDTLARLESMASMGGPVPVAALRAQIASGVNIVVQVARLQDGSRKVTHVSEVLGLDADASTYRTQDIFRREYHGAGEHGRVLSDLVPTGVLPRALPQLHEHGVDLPSSVYEAAERSPRA
jgi:pilus assembly protein CpaF